MKPTYVVDASVVLKWYIKTDEEDTETAFSLREDYRKRAIDLYSPSLLSYEVINVLRYKMGLEVSYIKDVAESLYEMRILREMDKEAMKEAIETALLFNTSIYDASYLSFAKQLSFPLITADYKLYQKLSRKEDIILVKDYKM